MFFSCMYYKEINVLFIIIQMADIFQAMKNTTTTTSEKIDSNFEKHLETGNVAVD